MAYKVKIKQQHGKKLTTYSFREKKSAEKFEHFAREVAKDLKSQNPKDFKKKVGHYKVSMTKE